jgi:hypothetical protein
MHMAIAARTRTKSCFIDGVFPRDPGGIHVGNSTFFKENLSMWWRCAKLKHRRHAPHIPIAPQRTKIVPFAAQAELPNNTEQAPDPTDNLPLDSGNAPIPEPLSAPVPPMTPWSHTQPHQEEPKKEAPRPNPVSLVPPSPFESDEEAGLTGDDEPTAPPEGPRQGEEPILPEEPIDEEPLQEPDQQEQPTEPIAEEPTQAPGGEEAEQEAEDTDGDGVPDDFDHDGDKDGPSDWDSYADGPVQLHENCHCFIHRMMGGRRRWDARSNACPECIAAQRAFNADQELRASQKPTLELQQGGSEMDQAA